MVSPPLGLWGEGTPRRLCAARPRAHSAVRPRPSQSPDKRKRPVLPPLTSTSIAAQPRAQPEGLEGSEATKSSGLGSGRFSHGRQPSDLSRPPGEPCVACVACVACDWLSLPVRMEGLCSGTSEAGAGQGHSRLATWMPLILPDPALRGGLVANKPELPPPSPCRLRPRPQAHSRGCRGG